jgi:uncharacterized repeat protein (TIGR01451 family)
MHGLSLWRGMALLALLSLAAAHSSLAARQNTPTVLTTTAQAMLLTEDPALPGLDPYLAGLAQEYATHLNRVQRGEVALAAFAPSQSLVPVVGEYVVVDAVANGDTIALQADLARLGAKNLASAGNLVSGLLPLAALQDAATLTTLRTARPSFATRSVGQTTSQGDQALRAAQARTAFGVDGSGITVGTLSDSYNCLGGAPAGVTSGDLPANVVVLEDYAELDCIDEGRAMMEIIHDLAPGANQQFHSAFNGIANFAQGIRDLAAAGSKVINDDIIYYAEPMFQDGPIAQSVDAVVNAGVPYFSSAGNNGRFSYESSFRPGPQQVSVNTSSATYVYTPHDFDPAGPVDTLQRITIPSGGSLIAVLQWDAPFASNNASNGAQTDLDLFFLNSAGSAIVGGVITNNLNDDAVEIDSFTNTSGSPLTINVLVGSLDSGTNPPEPGYVKLVYFFNGTINEFNTSSSTLYGHANAAKAVAVGAASYANTPAFGVNPPVLRSFSAGGGTPIFFNADGTRKTSTENRPKPEITAADGVNTTFFDPSGNGDFDGDGFPNFSGTSAAAPHAAAVAALMLQADASLTPAQILTAMQETAIDMGTAGFDSDSGAGLIQADAALATLRNTADLRLTLSAEAYTAPSRTLTYTLTLTNLGPETARSVAISNTLPSGVTFVQASAPGGNCTRNGNLVNCPIGTLANGASAITTIRVTVTAQAGTTITNTALVSTTDDDPTASDNSASVITKVINAASSANLSLSASANTFALNPGAPLTYTLAITNQGPAAATNMTATITLPSNVTYGSATGAGWNCTRNGTAVTCTRANLAANASAPITITVTTTATTLGDLLLSSTVTAATPDLDSQNNRGTVAVRVGRSTYIPLIRN